MEKGEGIEHYVVLLHVKTETNEKDSFILDASIDNLSGSGTG